MQILSKIRSYLKKHEQDKYCIDDIIDAKFRVIKFWLKPPYCPRSAIRFETLEKLYEFLRLGDWKKIRIIKRRRKPNIFIRKNKVFIINPCKHDPSRKKKNIYS